jgi:threonine dehydrogenase-like Zn-dependent dehydrogenase
VAPGRGDIEGARVVGEINAVCGSCEACRGGRPTHCSKRSVLGIQGRGGCLAEFTVLPVANLHVVPDGVDDESAVFTEPLAAAYRIGEQLDLSAFGPSLVMGDGKLGLLVAMALHASGVDVLLSGRNDPKLGVATRAGVKTVRADALERAGFDLVVECTGTPGGLTEALSRVRPMGTIVLKSTVAGDTTAPMSMGVVNEVTIVGSRCGPFAPALEALSQGLVDVRPLVSDRCGLSDGMCALERAADPTSLKVLVDPAR